MEFLIAALSDSESEVRAAAVTALRERLCRFRYLSYTGDLAPLAKFMDNTRARGLYRINPRAIAVWLIGESKRPEAIPYLLEAVNSEDRVVCEAAVRAIAAYRFDERAAAALVKALRHKDRHVRLFALHALIQPFEVSAYGAIVDLPADEDDEVRRTAEAALTRF